MPADRTLRLRSCDIATVRGGVIASHHFHYDQMDFLGQFGLLSDAPA